MFIVQWVWGSLFGTQCLVCLEPNLNIKWQGELAHGWQEASLSGCYQDTHTHAIISLSAECRLPLRVWCVMFNKREKCCLSNKKHWMDKLLFKRCVSHLLSRTPFKTAWTPVALWKQPSQFLTHFWLRIVLMVADQGLEMWNKIIKIANKSWSVEGVVLPSPFPLPPFI